MSQIALPRSVRRADDPVRVAIGNANRAAVDALAAPSGWPFGTAILAGPPRSGKSLLARWFEAQGQGEVVDGADALDETDLLQRWNRAQESGRPLLLVADGAETRDGAAQWCGVAAGGRPRLRLVSAPTGRAA